MNKKKISVALDRDIVEAITARAELEGSNVSALINDCLRRHAPRVGKVWGRIEICIPSSASWGVTVDDGDGNFWEEYSDGEYYRSGGYDMRAVFESRTGPFSREMVQLFAAQLDMTHLSLCPDTLISDTPVLPGTGDPNSPEPLWRIQVFLPEPDKVSYEIVQAHKKRVLQILRNLARLTIDDIQTNRCLDPDCGRQLRRVVCIGDSVKQICLDGHRFNAG